jgi:hypothetical protein
MAGRRKEPESDDEERKASSAETEEQVLGACDFFRHLINIYVRAGDVMRYILFEAAKGHVISLKNVQKHVIKDRCARGNSKK